MGSVSRKNNWDETVGVFKQEKVWLKNSLSHSGGGVTGRGHVQVEKQAVEGKDLQVEACSNYVRDKRPYVGTRKGSQGMVEIKLVCFRWLSPKHV